MPPTAATPSLPTSGYNPVLYHPVSQSIQIPATGQHSSIFVQPFPMMNVQAHGPVQLTEGWTTFLPIASPNGQMMVPVLQQGLVGAPPSALPVNQTYMPCQIPAVPHPSLLPPPPPPPQSLFNPLANSTNMEIVWHGVFENLFSQFQQSWQHNWNLMPLGDVQVNNFQIFRDSAKVRFLCQTCGKAWTSMKGRVVFWFQMWPEHSQGLVLFKLYGQKCEKCNQKVFEHAMWYPEEVNKVLTNVFHAVGKAYYGLAEAPVYRERRKGKPRTQHNTSLCQACADRVCKEGICQ